MRTSRARRHDYLRGEPQVNLEPLLRRLFTNSPARRPENDHPTRHVQGGEPLPMLPLEGKKSSFFPLGLKPWWKNEPEAMRTVLVAIVIFAAAGLVALPFLDYLVDQIHSLIMGK